MAGRNDNYPTPQYLANWAVEYAIKSNNVTFRNFLEPGCGGKAPFSVAAYRAKVDHIRSIDNRSVERPKSLIGLSNVGYYTNTDFLGPGSWEEDRFGIIATNPPFSKAQEFIWRSLDLLDDWGVMIFLLKLPFLSALSRIRLYKERPPKEVIVLQRRPSFSNNSRTDMTEYGFYVWYGKKYMEFLKLHNKDETVLKWLDNKKLEKEYNEKI